jgi:hypothetical protein
MQESTHEAPGNDTPRDPATPQEPRVLFLDASTGDYWNARSAIFNELGILKAVSLVKGGLVLPAPPDTQSAGYGPYTKGHGRTMVTSSSRTPADRQRQWVSRLLASLNMDEPSQEFIRSLVLQGVDCLAFSDLSNNDWMRILSLPDVITLTVASASFRVDDPYARYFVWDRLILVGIVSDGIALSHYEDVPDEFDPVEGNEDLATFHCLRDHAQSPEIDGHFYDNGAGYPLSIEKGAENTAIPAELPIADQISYRQTPMAYAIDNLPFQGVDKISTRDSAESNAQVELGDAVLQFPDLQQVQSKVRLYCLNPGQIERKFEGFEQAGYFISEPHHAEILAAFIASALYQEFPIGDQRVTADGHIQFTVHVALPTIDGGLVPILTAWVGGQNRKLALATAFRAKLSGELAGTAHIPAHLVDTEDWSALYNHVAEKVLDYASSLDGDGYPFANAHIWIEHNDARSKAFAKWMRQTSRAFNYRFSRVRYGGPVTLAQFPIGQDWVSEASAAAMGNYAEVLFLLSGIRVHFELSSL